MFFVRIQDDGERLLEYFRWVRQRAGQLQEEAGSLQDVIIVSRLIILAGPGILEHSLYLKKWKQPLKLPSSVSLEIWTPTNLPKK
eukprot:833896-Amphidinium_carterae.1